MGHWMPHPYGGMGPPPGPPTLPEQAQAQDLGMNRGMVTGTATVPVECRLSLALVALVTGYRLSNG